MYGKTSFKVYRCDKRLRAMGWCLVQVI